jgi:hypothetical protein
VGLPGIQWQVGGVGGPYVDAGKPVPGKCQHGGVEVDTDGGGAVLGEFGNGQAGTAADVDDRCAMVQP